MMLTRCLGLIFKHRKKLLIVALAAIIVAFSLLIYANLVIYQYEASTYSSVDECPRKELGVILGTNPYTRGRLSPTLQARLYAGWELYNAGKIKQILLSGGADTQKYYFETSFMKDALVRLGVREEDITEDNLGLRTLDSVLRTRYVFHKNDFIIISQKTHVVRALYLADHNRDIHCIGYAAEDPPNIPDVDLASILRAPIANVRAVLDVILHKSASRPYDTPQQVYL